MPIENVFYTHLHSPVHATAQNLGSRYSFHTHGFLKNGLAGSNCRIATLHPVTG